MAIFATSSSAVFQAGNEVPEIIVDMPDRRPPKNPGKRNPAAQPSDYVRVKNMKNPHGCHPRRLAPSNMNTSHRILRTRRPVTYTVNVDCIPPCQPGLDFPPHAVRLARRKRVAAARKRDSLSTTAFTRYLRARRPSRRRSIVGLTPKTGLMTLLGLQARPRRVCDGSSEEDERIIAEMLREGDSETLNEKTYPTVNLHRSSPNDVAPHRASDLYLHP